MGRPRRVMPFLQRRKAAWYFHFKLPSRLRLFTIRAELCISLTTCELTVARQRVERVLPDVYRLKQLGRCMSSLDPSHVKKALDIAFGELVAKLERTKEPWRREHSPFSLSNGASVRLNSLGGLAASGLLEMKLQGLRWAIQAKRFAAYGGNLQVPVNG